MFGSSAGRPKKKFYWQLTTGEPITPRHQRPCAIGDDYPTFVRDSDRQFFVDFFEFGDVVNWWLADEYSGSRWRLQELPDTELKLGVSDSPDFGRRYEVFCGPIKLGTLELTPSYPYGADETNVRVSIELMWVRLLSWDTIVDFLASVASHISSRGNASNYSYIQTALNRCLWNSLAIHDQDLGLDWGTLEVTLEGNAEFYFDRKSSENFRAEVVRG